MKGSPPPNTLYAKVFLVMPTIYFTAFVIQGSFLMNWDKIISFTNKKIRKKLKVLVALLINQKIGGHLGFLPRSFSYQNHSIKIMRKPFIQKKYANFVLIIPLRRAKIQTCIDSKTFRNYIKKQVFSTESKKRH